jgi:hypothetical protein
MKHLQYYLDDANSSARTAKYSKFIGNQGTAVVRTENASHNVGSNWFVADQAGSMYSVQATSAGLEALVNAAKVRAFTCAHSHILIWMPA